MHNHGRLGFVVVLNGEVLRRLRLDAGLTQQELADRAGLRQAHIATIEGGRDVRLSTLSKIFQALNVEIVVKDKRSDALLKMLSRVDDKLDLVLEKLDKK